MKFLDVPRSGSYQGITSSRNRFGQYIRTRATPVNPGSSQQGVVRARMSLNATGYRALTDAQRAGWEALALLMSRTDSLGQAYTMNGFSAYCSVNNNKLAAGDVVVSDAPAMTAPVNIVTATVTLTAIAFSIAYTATPLSAATKLFVYCSPQRTAGRAYESDYRLIGVSAAALASPFAITTLYAPRLGIPVVGNRIFMAFHAYNGGFRSGPLKMSQVVA